MIHTKNYENIFKFVSHAQNTVLFFPDTVLLWFCIEIENVYNCVDKVVTFVEAAM